MEFTKELAEKVLNIVDQGIGLSKQRKNVYQIVMNAFCVVQGNESVCQCQMSSLFYRFISHLSNARWSSDEARTKGLRRLAIAQLGTPDTLDEQLFKRVESVAIKTLLPKIIRAAAVIQEEPHKAKLLEAAHQCEVEGTDEAAYAAAGAALKAAAKVDPFPSPDTVSVWLESIDTALVDNVAARWARTAIHFIASVTCEDDVADLACAADFAAKLVAVEAEVDAAVNFPRQLLRPADDFDAADRLLSNFAEEVVQIFVEMETPGSKFLYLTQKQ